MRFSERDIKSQGTLNFELNINLFCLTLREKALKISIGCCNKNFLDESVGLVRSCSCALAFMACFTCYYICFILHL